MLNFFDVFTVLRFYCYSSPFHQFEQVFERNFDFLISSGWGKSIYMDIFHELEVKAKTRKLRFENFQREFNVLLNSEIGTRKDIKLTILCNYYIHILEYFSVNEILEEVFQYGKTVFQYGKTLIEEGELFYLSSFWIKFQATRIITEIVTDITVRQQRFITLKTSKTIYVSGLDNLGFSENRYIYEVAPTRALIIITPINTLRKNRLLLAKCIIDNRISTRFVKDKDHWIKKQTKLTNELVDKTKNFCRISKRESSYKIIPSISIFPTNIYAQQIVRKTKHKKRDEKCLLIKLIFGARIATFSIKASTWIHDTNKTCLTFWVSFFSHDIIFKSLEVNFSTFTVILAFFNALIPAPALSLKNQDLENSKLLSDDEVVPLCSETLFSLFLRIGVIHNALISIPNLLNNAYGDTQSSHLRARSCLQTSGKAILSPYVKDIN